MKISPSYVRCSAFRAPLDALRFYQFLRPLLPILVGLTLVLAALFVTQAVSPDPNYGRLPHHGSGTGGSMKTTGTSGGSVGQP